MAFASGTVTLRLRTRTQSAANKTLIWSAKNLGPKYA